MNNLKRSSTQLRKLIIFGIMAGFTVSGLIISSHLILEKNIETNEHVAEIINMSGRQRLLSQRATSIILKLLNSRDFTNRKELRQELLDTANLLEGTHKEMTGNKVSIIFPEHMSNQMKEIFFAPPFNLDIKCKEFIGEIKYLLSLPDTELSINNTRISELLGSKSEELLKAFDASVKQFQKEHEEAVHILERRGNIMAVISIFILLAMSFFIFRPMIMRLKRYTIALEESEIKLLKAKKLAEKSSEAKSEFLASMSHEIRTPMHLIIGMADILKDTKLNSQQKSYLQKILKAGDNLLSLINNILDLSKIEANKINIKEVEFNLEELLCEIESLMGVMAREKGLRLSVHRNGIIPKIVRGDPYFLKQVLYNLMSNAIKFTEEGRIDVKVSRKDSNNVTEELEFCVSDTGIGIAEDKIEIIFDRFTQADTSTTRNYGGTGLGTTISKNIVEKMGGRMWAKSLPGKGSSFYFTVKLKPAEKSTVYEESPGKTIHFDHPLNILIVDDSEDNIMLMKMYFKDTPHLIDTAENGKVALTKLQSGNYDLVLMDMEMPVMDGYTATKEIRKWEESRGGRVIPILAVTAHALREHEQKSLYAGCTAHISKPIKRERFLEAIHNASSVKHS